jgi:hypothetical protein
VKEELDKSVEFISKKQFVKYCLWINTSDGKFREAKTKFKHSTLNIMEIPKALASKSCIIRVFWVLSDLRELQKKDLCPYISISGFFITDLIYHPEVSKKSKNWSLRNMVEDKYKMSVVEQIQSQKFKIKIELPQNVYIKNLDQSKIKIAKYIEDKSSWNFDNFETLEQDSEKKYTIFLYNDLGIFSLVLERNLFFPYKSWYLRCIKKDGQYHAILDLESK